MTQHGEDSSPPSDAEISVWRVQRRDGRHDIAVLERDEAEARYISEEGLIERVTERANPERVARAVRDSDWFDDASRNVE